MTVRQFSHSCMIGKHQWQTFSTKESISLGQKIRARAWEKKKKRRREGRRQRGKGARGKENKRQRWGGRGEAGGIYWAPNMYQPLWPSAAHPHPRPELHRVFHQSTFGLRGERRGPLKSSLQQVGNLKSHFILKINLHFVFYSVTGVAFLPWGRPTATGAR